MRRRDRCGPAPCSTSGSETNFRCTVQQTGGEVTGGFGDGRQMALHLAQLNARLGGWLSA
jgi:hypothetical protein